VPSAVARREPFVRCSARGAGVRPARELRAQHARVPRMVSLAPRNGHHSVAVAA
jgi:hypothetical protein